MEAGGEHQRGGLAHVVGVGLERQPQQGHGLAHQRTAEMPLELAYHPALLQLVYLDHSRQQLEVVAGVARQLLESAHVFG